VNIQRLVSGQSARRRRRTQQAGRRSATAATVRPGTGEDARRLVLSMAPMIVPNVSRMPMAGGHGLRDGRLAGMYRARERNQAPVVEQDLRPEQAERRGDRCRDERVVDRRQTTGAAASAPTAARRSNRGDDALGRPQLSGPRGAVLGLMRKIPVGLRLHRQHQRASGREAEDEIRTNGMPAAVSALESSAQQEVAGDGDSRKPTSRPGTP